MSLSRVKRRVLAGALRDNVETMRPREARSPRWWSPRWWPRRRVRLAAALALGLVAAGGVAWLAARQLPDGPLAGERSASPSSASAALGATGALPGADPGATSGVAPSPRFGAPDPVARSAFPLPVRRVVLDPGHGGDQAGTRVPGGPQGGGLEEKAITLDIARRLRALLVADGYEVAMTRQGDEAVTLEERAARANAARGDVFVSIHVNWVPQHERRGVETYFLGATDDPQLVELAARENRGSGYSLADLRELLEGLYADVRQEDSRRLAEAVQRELHDSVRRVSPGVEDWGVKRAPFVVLIHTRMPAILAEVSCLSHQEEARLLGEEAYRELIALALYGGIRSYAFEAAGLAEAR